MQSTARRDRPLPPRLEIAGITMSASTALRHASAAHSVLTVGPCLNAQTVTLAQHCFMATLCLLYLNAAGMLTSCRGRARVLDADCLNGIAI